MSAERNALNATERINEDDPHIKAGELGGLDTEAREPSRGDGDIERG